MESSFQGKLQATTIITKNRNESLRFYQDGLGYQQLEEGILSEDQKTIFGDHLGRYTLLGHDRASVLRLIETNDENAQPHRLNAKPWDIGLCVMEAGAPDIQEVYNHLIRNRFGVIAPPKEFSVEGPEPLGRVVMKALGLFGPNGEQMFITQITQREGGTPLWELRNDITVFAPGNVVISMKDRSAQIFYKHAFGLEPTIDLPLNQPDAAIIMGGPSDMSFRMCLMGKDQYKSGLEQHVYGSCNPEYTFKNYPSDFTKTGLASACWKGRNLKKTSELVMSNGGQILATTLLPLRNNAAPKGIVFRGLAGEIIELTD